MGDVNIVGVCVCVCDSGTHDDDIVSRANH